MFSLYHLVLLVGNYIMPSLPMDRNLSELTILKAWGSSYTSKKKKSVYINNNFNKVF